MRDLVGFHFGCSDFARSHSMTNVEGESVHSLHLHTCYLRLRKADMHRTKDRCFRAASCSKVRYGRDAGEMDVRIGFFFWYPVRHSSQGLPTSRKRFW
jgi:hypothetical protein